MHVSSVAIHGIVCIGRCHAPRAAAGREGESLVAVDGFGMSPDSGKRDNRTGVESQCQLQAAVTAAAACRLPLP